MLEHQVVAVAAQEPSVRAAHRDEHAVAVPRAALREGRCGLAERVFDAFEAALERRDEELALAAKEAEHVRLRHTDATCDALDGSPVDAPTGELVDRRRDQLLAPLRGGHAAA